MSTRLKWTRSDVPDFRVSHEPVAETYSQTMGLQGTIAVVIPNFIHIGSIAAFDCVALFDFGHTPAIMDTASG